MYYCNINGFKSKQISIREIVSKLQPKVIVFCETKLPSGQALKKLFPEYEICARSTKTGKCGVAIGIKLQTFKSVLDVTSTDLQDIVAVRISMETCTVRVILGYAPQETETVEVRENFFTEMEIEVAKCKMEDEIPLVIGDLNAKIEWNDNKIIAITPNGRLLKNMVESHELEVINFSQVCTGKWTHVIRTTGASSVLDYVITSSELRKSIEELVIDEERVFCPFSIKKGKLPQFSDHNAFIMKMTIEHSKKKMQPEVSWMITPNGLNEFKQLTKYNLREIDANTTQKRYNMLEKNIHDAMNQCFKKRKNKEIPALQKDFYKKYKTITAFSKKGKAQREVAKTYLQEIIKLNAEATASIRYQKVVNTIEKLTINHSFSPDSFWKLCKKAKKQTMMCTSIETEEGIELFGEDIIRNAYKDEFAHRLRRREIIPDLKNYELRTEQVCELKLREARVTKEPDYTMEELEKVLSKLKRGKSSGRDKIPPEVFMESGSKLLNQILQFLNHMKRAGDMVKQWTEVQVTPMYKNKGKRKRLVNQRGIFLKQVLSKIFERQFPSWWKTRPKPSRPNVSHAGSYRPL